MDANIAMTHFTIGAVTVAALQWVKSSKWFPWIQAGQTKLLRALSALVAAAAAVGIGYTWNAHDHSLTITGLTLSGIAIAFWAWLKQFAVQEFMYRATKPALPPGVFSVPRGVSAGAFAQGSTNPSVTDSAAPVAPVTK
jgi:hypothetical protein